MVTKKSSKMGKGKKLNPWMKHLSDYKKSHPGKSHKECMMLAKKSYKPMKK